MAENDQLGGHSEQETPDDEAERRADIALRGLLPARRNTQWPWGRLRHETLWRGMELADVEGPQGVEGCYELSMIPDEFILRLAGETAERVHALVPESMGDAARDKQVEEQRGGMLHRFRQPPVYRYAPNKKTESVYESMMRQLEQSKKAIADGPSEGVAPSLYEGAVLVPKDDPKQVLAWLTWWRSRQSDPSLRSSKNDQLVKEVQRLFEKPQEGERAREDILLHAGITCTKYRQGAPATLLFDTVNAREPGGASILFDHLVPIWRQAGYQSILTYRHKILEVLHREGSQTPRGDNEASGRFFARRLIAEIGTRVNNYLAVRHIGEQEYKVSSTEGWMFGNLAEVERASHALVQKRRQ